jgi:hypothetical protein
MVVCGVRRLVMDGEQPARAVDSPIRIARWINKAYYT